MDREVLLRQLLDRAYGGLFNEYKDHVGNLIRNIDPHGDLKIKCFGSFCIRVSSKIVSCMSPALEGLIRCEKQRNNSAPMNDSPLTLDLSNADDNPFAMEMLMHLMHFSTGLSAPDMDVEKSRICCEVLDKLSILAEKYLCYLLHGRQLDEQNSDPSHQYQRLGQPCAHCVSSQE